MKPIVYIAIGGGVLLLGAAVASNAPAKSNAPHGLPTVPNITYRQVMPDEYLAHSSEKRMYLYGDVDGISIPLLVEYRGSPVTWGTPAANTAFSRIKAALKSRWDILNRTHPQKNYDAGDQYSHQKFWGPIQILGPIGEPIGQYPGAAIPFDEYGRGYPGTYGGGSTFNVLGTLAQLAGMVLPFIPGIGTGASIALGFVVALGRGASVQDAAIAGARNALPPGPARMAFDAGVGVAIQGKPLEQAAQDALFQQYPQAKAAYNQGKQLAQEVL